MKDFDLDAQDRHLKKLAIAAQTAEVATERRRYLNQLVTLVIRSNRLCRPHQARLPFRYEEIYEEAVQDLWLYVSDNIDKYDPARSPVMAWLNMLMKRRFVFEASKKILGNLEISRQDIGDLGDHQMPKPDGASLSELVEDYINEDPDYVMQEHIKNFPQATFQAIAQRYVQGISWKEMSAEFQVPIPTLSSFYQRRIKKYEAQIKQHIQQYS